MYSCLDKCPENDPDAMLSFDMGPTIVLVESMCGGDVETGGSGGDDAGDDGEQAGEKEDKDGAAIRTGVNGLVGVTVAGMMVAMGML